VQRGGDGQGGKGACQLIVSLAFLQAGPIPAPLVSSSTNSDAIRLSSPRAEHGQRQGFPPVTRRIITFYLGLREALQRDGGECVRNPHGG